MTNKALPKELTCGIVMPISPLDGCSTEHWLDVQSIIKEAVAAIEEPNFTARLVSASDEIGVIQKRIVQGLYNSEIVVCDVSGKNPNVMFELGLRLAFDKPTVIVKDDRTDYSFDTGIIEHIPYPRDLRFGRIVQFKQRLSDKIAATYKASQEDPQHSPFLKSFGQFKVVSLNEKEISSDAAILEMLSDVKEDVAALKRRTDVSEGGRGFRVVRESRNVQKLLLPERAKAVRDAIEEWKRLGHEISKSASPELLKFVSNFVQGRFGPVHDSILDGLVEDILGSEYQ